MINKDSTMNGFRVNRLIVESSTIRFSICMCHFVENDLNYTDHFLIVSRQGRSCITRF